MPKHNIEIVTNSSSELHKHVEGVYAILSDVEMDVAPSKIELDRLIEYALELEKIRFGLREVIAGIISSDEFPKEPRVYLRGNVWDYSQYYASIERGFSYMAELDEFFDGQFKWLEMGMTHGVFDYGEDALRRAKDDKEILKNLLTKEIELFSDWADFSGYSLATEAYQDVNSRLDTLEAEICKRPCRDLSDVLAKVHFVEGQVKSETDWTQRLKMIMKSMKSVSVQSSRKSTR